MEDWMMCSSEPQNDRSSFWKENRGCSQSRTENTTCGASEWAGPPSPARASCCSACCSTLSRPSPPRPVSNDRGTWEKGRDDIIVSMIGRWCSWCTLVNNLLLGISFLISSFVIKHNYNIPVPITVLLFMLTQLSWVCWRGSYTLPKASQL